MRPWRGHGFGALVPEDWVDRTTPALTGPLVGGDRAGLVVTIDEKPGASNAEAFAASRLPAAMAPPGKWELLSQEHITNETAGAAVGESGSGARSAADAKAVAVELRWEGRGQARLFRRLYYRVLDRVGYTVTSNLRPASRKLMGPAMARMALSLERVDPAQEDTALVPAVEPGRYGGGRFIAAGFAMDLYPGWEDASLYRIGRPRGPDLLPNLVVWHQALRDTGWTTRTLFERARAETEEMRATIPGFELIAEGETTLSASLTVPRREFYREASAGMRVRQAQIVVVGSERLYTPCVTCDAEAPDEDVATAAAVLESFALAPAMSGVAASARG